MQRKNMKINTSGIPLIILCLVVAFLLGGNCTYDERAYDGDQIYGSSGRNCSYEDVNLWSVGARAFGLYLFGHLFYYAKQETEKNRALEELKKQLAKEIKRA